MTWACSGSKEDFYSSGQQMKNKDHVLALLDVIQAPGALS
jgi:hypothetical protein